jgi:hypothetical protein
MATNPDISSVNSAVNEQITNANTRSTSAASDASNFLQMLANSAIIGAPSTGLTLPGEGVMSMSITPSPSPDRPTAAINAIKARIGLAPESTFTTEVHETSYPTIEERVIPRPDVTLPDAPSFTTELPAEVPLIASVTNVDSPTEPVPDKLTSIGNYTIPEVPSINTPDFGEALPPYSLSIPALQFSYVEAEYTSALKTALDAKLQSELASGGTGLSEEVEDAIWERTRERDDRDYEDARDKVNSLWAGKNFSLPDGVLVENQQDLVIDDRNQRLERSRDILIKQAELAQVNTHFIITSSLSLEQLELSHANNVNNRALEAAKATIELGIAIYNMQIADYNIQLERYKAKQFEVSARLEIERLRLEAFKAELQGAEAKGNIDKNLLAEYNLDLERYDKYIKLFNAEQGAVQTALGIEGLKINFYNAQISDYRSRIEAQRNEAELYKAQVEGELGKVTLYTAELDAEKTRIGTLKVMTDLEIAKLDENIKLQEFELRAFLGNIEAYKAEVSVAITELGLEGTMYGHDIDKFRGEVQRDVANLNLSVETLIKGRALDIQNTNVRLENAKANLQSLLSTAELRVAAAKGIGDSYASITAAVMSGFSAIASIESAGLSTENAEID